MGILSLPLLPSSQPEAVRELTNLCGIPLTYSGTEDMSLTRLCATTGRKFSPSSYCKYFGKYERSFINCECNRLYSSYNFGSCCKSVNFLSKYSFFDFFGSMITKRSVLFSLNTARPLLKLLKNTFGEYRPTHSLISLSACSLVFEPSNTSPSI